MSKICSVLPNGNGHCESGTCVLDTCDDGWGNCDGVAGNGCEIDITVDRDNCGACGNVCAANERCINGACACDVCASGCRHTSIQAAVDAASPGDTIRLCSGTYRESATIIVNKNLTFVGTGDGEGGTVVDGQAVRAVISIRTSGPVIMRHLRISGGMLHGGEGAGLNNSGTTTLEHCTVTDNHVPYDGTDRANGGGIYNSGDLTLTDCTVSENEAGGMVAEFTIMARWC